MGSYLHRWRNLHRNPGTAGVEECTYMQIESKHPREGWNSVSTTPLAIARSFNDTQTVLRRLVVASRFVFIVHVSLSTSLKMLWAYGRQGGLAERNYAFALPIKICARPPLERILGQGMYGTHTGKSRIFSAREPAQPDVCRGLVASPLNPNTCPAATVVTNLDNFDVGEVSRGLKSHRVAESVEAVAHHANSLVLSCCPLAA